MFNETHTIDHVVMKHVRFVATVCVLLTEIGHPRGPRRPWLLAARDGPDSSRPATALAPRGRQRPCHLPRDNDSGTTQKKKKKTEIEIKSYTQCFMANAY